MTPKVRFSLLCALTAAALSAGCPEEDSQTEQVQKARDDSKDAGTDGSTNQEDANAEGDDSTQEDADVEGDDSAPDIIAPYGGASKCNGPPVETIYEHTDKVHGIAVIGDNLFVGANDGLYVLPTDGSASPMMLSDHGTGQLAVVDDSLIALSEPDGAVRRWDGSVFEDLENEAGEITVYGDTAYYWTFGCGTLVNYVSSEGAAQQIPFGKSCVQGFAATDESFYWIERDFSARPRTSQVWRQPADGGDSVAIGQKARFKYNSLFLAGADLFASIERSTNISDPVEELVKIDGKTGEVEKVAGPVWFGGSVSDSEGVFIADYAEGGCIYRLDSKTLVSVGSAAGSLEQLALDEEFVYAASFDGEIVRTRRR